MSRVKKIQNEGNILTRPESQKKLYVFQCFVKGGN